MIEALYGVEFVSNHSDGGYGVAVLETQRILGGDSSFVFIGSYEVKNGHVAAEVRCTNDRKILPSIFGSELEQFTLSLSGDTDPEHQEFTLYGHVVENPSLKIGIKLTRRAELP